mgnify:CR=1 FL=1
MKNKEKDSPSLLPLFEYARQFEDFSAFEDFDHYFIHCLQTSGFKMHIIAEWMHLSGTGLSIRMNHVDPEQPRFNTRHIDSYISNSGDSRPNQYLEWRAKQAKMNSQDVLRDRLTRLLPHLEDLRSICDALEGKK